MMRNSLNVRDGRQGHVGLMIGEVDELIEVLNTSVVKKSSDDQTTNILEFKLR
jgi:hypothetical protein